MGVVAFAVTTLVIGGGSTKSDEPATTAATTAATTEAATTEAATTQAATSAAATEAATNDEAKPAGKGSSGTIATNDDGSQTYYNDDCGFSFTFPAGTEVLDRIKLSGSEVGARAYGDDVDITISVTREPNEWGSSDASVVMGKFVEQETNVTYQQSQDDWFIVATNDCYTKAYVGKKYIYQVNYQYQEADSDTCGPLIEASVGTLRVNGVQ